MLNVPICGGASWTKVLSLTVVVVMMWQATFESMEADLKEMNNGVETLERNLVELQELLYVLQYTAPFFEHVSLPQLIKIMVVV